MVCKTGLRQLIMVLPFGVQEFRYVIYDILIKGVCFAYHKKDEVFPSEKNFVVLVLYISPAMGRRIPANRRLIG